MNMNLKLDLNPKALLKLLENYSRTIIFFTAIALIAYTGFQISRVTGVQADQSYVEKNREKSKVTNLKVDKQALDQIKSLRSSGDTTVPTGSGKFNPFSL